MPDAGQAGQQHRGRLLAEAGGAFLAGDVARFAQLNVDWPTHRPSGRRGSRAVARSRIMPAPTVTLVMRSMTMKAPVAAVAAVAVEGDRLAERHGAAADLVQLQRRASRAMQRVDVDLVAQRR